MNLIKIRWRAKDFLAVLLFLQSMVCASVLFDISVVRQVVGFIYFTFVPGFIFIKLLKFDNLSGLQKVTFSMGFGIAYLLFIGLIVNEFGFLFGITRPLSLMPLTIILSIPILVGGIIVYLRSKSVYADENKKSALSYVKSSPFALLFICLPILSVVGTFWLSAYSSNLILMLLIIAISILFVMGVLSEKFLSPRLYPLAIFTIAISLLYHYSLISNYLVSLGSDVNIEYYISNIAVSSGHWSSTPLSSWLPNYGRIDAMLSITILPPIYSILLNMDLSWIFKIMFPIIFAFVPLGLYQVCQIYISRRYALIATFLFMAESTFYTEMLGLNRQIVGEVFFVLLLFVILNRKLKPAHRAASFTIFSFALITSHYALAEIFLFLIVVIFVSLFVLKRQDSNVTPSMIALFFVMMFGWYIYTSSATVFDSFISFTNHVANQLGDFLNPASRGSTFQIWANPIATSPTIWNVISRMFVYITQVLIVLGFVGVLIKRKELNFNISFLILGSAAMTLLVSLILVPGLADTLNMTRFYHILLLFLAPFFVLGADVIVKFVPKPRKQIVASVLLLIVLVPYFLFQTGFVYEVMKVESWSLPLSMNRMSNYKLQRLLGFVNEQDVVGAIWMSRNVPLQYTPTFADVSSQVNLLTIHSMLQSGSVNPLSNITVIPSTGTVYLSSLNTVNGIVVGAYHIWNSSELSQVFDGLDKIYSNGASEIYKSGYPKLEKEAP